MRYAFALAAVLCASPALAQQPTAPAPGSNHDARPQFDISTGVDFERGDFGTGAQVDKIAIPLTAGVSIGSVRVSAQLPWVRVTAPANVIAPTGPLGLPILVDPTRPATRTTRQGLGDLRLGAAYDLPVQGIVASVRAAAKLPTASVDKGLGTGKADYSVGADVAKPLGAVTPYAGVTYTMAGDPEGFQLRNSFSGQAGAALRLGGSASAQLGYAYAQNPIEAGEDDQRIVGGLHADVGRSLSLGVYGSGGLSAGAPRLGGGVTLGLKFGR
ncbi:transporter [Sphingomonas sp. ST-64]|uniref:Transporter n=1 Tax=Sphingomonas plantiphila TaxID=3163295 RepID=A0ABW8YLI0_9SPHN